MLRRRRSRAFLWLTFLLLRNRFKKIVRFASKDLIHHKAENILPSVFVKK